MFCICNMLHSESLQIHSHRSRPIIYSFIILFLLNYWQQIICICLCRSLANIAFATQKIYTTADILSSYLRLSKSFFGGLHVSACTRVTGEAVTRSTFKINENGTPPLCECLEAIGPKHVAQKLHLAVHTCLSAASQAPYLSRAVRLQEH